MTSLTITDYHSEESWLPEREVPGDLRKKQKKNVRSQNLIQNNNKEDSWKTGRRIVELGLLSENLKCSCGNNLHLKDIKS